MPHSPTTPRPRIVTLCGSTRFWDELAEANMRETIAGRIVLAPGVNMKASHPAWADPAAAEALKADLDALHKDKIRLADVVLVVNPDGYVGESTRSEIIFARAQDKPIRFTYQPRRVVIPCIANWEKPPGVVRAGRGTAWQEPDGWQGAGLDRSARLMRYADHLDAHPELVRSARSELAGCDLGCYCRPKDLCHADLLVAITNSLLAPGVDGASTVREIAAALVHIAIHPQPEIRRALSGPRTTSSGTEASA